MCVLIKTQFHLIFCLLSDIIENFSFNDLCTVAYHLLHYCMLRYCNMINHILQIKLSGYDLQTYGI